jgi:hypothetical protein
MMGRINQIKRMPAVRAHGRIRVEAAPRFLGAGASWRERPISGQSAQRFGLPMWWWVGMAD